MVITDIAVTKRGRYSLFVDGEFTFSVDGQTVLSYGLKKGLQVDCGFMDELQSVCLLRKCRESALDYLSRRPHGERELVKKLQKKYPAPVCETVVAELMDAGLIDDLAFAKGLAEEYVNYRGYSARRVREELYKRSFSRDVIGEVMDTLPGDETETVKTLVERQYYRKLGTPDGAEKVKAALVRRGFSYRTVNEVLKEYITEEDF